MKWGMAEIDGEESLVVCSNDGVRSVSEQAAQFFGRDRFTLHDLIRRPPSDREEFAEMVQQGLERNRATTPASAFKIAAPLRSPGKILCIGLNYADHASEGGKKVPSEPVFFSKYATSIIGPSEAIRKPAFVKQLDYEAELAVVIGVRGRYISKDHAMDHVFGYTIMNDVTARDWQFRTGQWVQGKAMDTFAPLGPWVVTRDALPQVQDCQLVLRLNGQIMQSALVREMVFPIPYLVSYLSQFVTLEPGDIIATGTPSGIGHRRNPPVYMQVGDTVEVAISGIGILSNTVADDEPAVDEFQLIS